MSKDKQTPEQRYALPGESKASHRKALPRNATFTPKDSLVRFSPR